MADKTCYSHILDAAVILDSIDRYMKKYVPTFDLDDEWVDNLATTIDMAMSTWHGSAPNDEELPGAYWITSMFMWAGANCDAFIESVKEKGWLSEGFSQESTQIVVQSDKPLYPELVARAVSQRIYKQVFRQVSEAIAKKQGL